MANTLQAASYNDHESIVRLLLKGARVDATGGYYDTALQAASHNGKEALVHLLLEKGAIAT
jgi:ankyrin repeat protein